MQVAGQALPLPAGGQLVGVFVEAGVLDGDGQLVGQSLRGEEVLLVQSRVFVGRYVEHAHQILPYADGNGDLGVGGGRAVRGLCVLGTAAAGSSTGRSSRAAWAIAG